MINPNAKGRRQFIKNVAAFSSLAFIPSRSWHRLKNPSLRTAHIGVGGMGMSDLKAISSHELVEVTALCDVDANNLAKASKLHSGAKAFADYRQLFDVAANEFDAVIISTPDHTHAPAAMMALEVNKHTYCQKPLTHQVTESRALAKKAMESNLVTQMGIQVHSFYDYKLTTQLIQSGIIGRVHVVKAWSNKSWGHDGPMPEGSDPVPTNLDWNLWLGTSSMRPFKQGLYHPGNWRNIVDHGCGTLGDMGVHIFDTPYNALDLGVPMTVKNQCRPPTGFGHPESNKVTYEFPGTDYTGETLRWEWYDGDAVAEVHNDLTLPNGDTLPDQGAMFIGETGNLLLPHFMVLPKLIVDQQYIPLDQSTIDQFDLGPAVRDYNIEGKKHYHQFVNACLDKDECSTPFAYAARLTETILLGVIAGNFPDQTLHWNRQKAEFSQKGANEFLQTDYREF